MQNLFAISTLATLLTVGTLTLVSCQTSEKSHIDQTGSEVFRNLPNSTLQTAPPNILKVIWRMATETKIGTVPVDAIPMQAVTRESLAALDPAQNHVIRLGHSSHLLKLQGKYWLIDPVFSQRASPVQFAGPKRFHPAPIPLTELPPIEGVILSHDHYDHLDKAVTEFLAKTSAKYFVPLKVGAKLIDMGVAKDRITELDWWGTATMGNVTLTATPAQHFSGRSLGDRNKTLWASWVMDVKAEAANNPANNTRIFYSGDGGYFSGFKEIGKRFPHIDLALIENGAYDKMWPDTHMTPEQSVDAFVDLGAKVLYPVHNSTFDLAFHQWRDPLVRIAKLSQSKNILLATPVIGEPLTIGRTRSNKEWWEGLK